MLNKSAVVLICAFWEAYCEDVAAEALAHLVEHTPDVGALPKRLRKQVAAELKENKDELAVWDLAEAGWRDVVLGRLDRYRIERNWDMNTPKADQIDDFFDRTLGLQKVSQHWRWSGVSASKARRKLNKYVRLRGDIAHRGSAAKAGSVHLSAARDFLNHVERLVKRTDAAVMKWTNESSWTVPE